MVLVEVGREAGEQVEPSHDEGQSAGRTGEVRNAVWLVREKELLGCH